MRNRCGAPNQEPAISVFVAVTPLFVRAYRPSPELLLNIAHSPSPKLTAKPACWNGAPLKVAVNSSDRPALKKLLVATSAPSTSITPPAMAAEGLPVHGDTVQPAGNVVPLNSAPIAGASSSSPSPVAAM